jgi:hypothetical protein
MQSFETNEQMIIDEFKIYIQQMLIQLALAKKNMDTSGWTIEDIDGDDSDDEDDD